MKTDYRIIDFHTHCFPDRIAGYAIAKLSDGAPNPPQYNGTEQGLLDYMDNNGVSESVVLNIATNLKQNTNVNKFALQLNSSPRLYAFGSVHPEAADYRERIDALIDGGIKGIKFHSFYQDFAIDDRKMFDIYEYINSKRLAVIFHMGLDTSFADDGRSSPRRLRVVHDNFPDITLIAAHMGGIGYAEETLKYLAGTNIYIETSYGFIYQKEMLSELFARHNKEYFLFGSDGPWSPLNDEITAIKNFIKDKTVLQMLFSANASRILTK